MDAPSPAASALEAGYRPSFAEASRVWLKVGLTSFGGPAGQIALMHRILVDEKRWIDEARYLHALNYCMLLPGPEAQQLATYVGWLLHGIRGGLVAGLLFILPGFLVIVGLSVAYVAFGGVPLVDGILFGIKAAVLAVVVEALLRVSRRALKTRTSLWIAIAAFVAIAFLSVPFPLIIAAAGLLGFMMTRNIPAAEAEAERTAAMDAPGAARTGSVVLVSIVLWLAPVVLLAAALGFRHVFTAEALFFSKTAIVTFGGAYAILAYVAQQAVTTYGWLRPDEMLTGLGLAETTPGPLILVLVFVGFLAAFREAGGLDPYLAGCIGALITLWVTFAPSFMFIFAGAPFIERLRSNARLSGALGAITAAVVGVIANLGLWFALHILFAEVGSISAGPMQLPAPLLSSFDPWPALIAVAAGVLLLRLHVGLGWVLGLAAAAGAAVRLLG